MTSSELPEKPALHFRGTNCADALNNEPVSIDQLPRPRLGSSENIQSAGSTGEDRFSLPLTELMDSPTEADYWEQGE